MPRFSVCSVCGVVNLEMVIAQGTTMAIGMQEILGLVGVMGYWRGTGSAATFAGGTN